MSEKKDSLQKVEQLKGSLKENKEELFIHIWKNKSDYLQELKVAKDKVKIDWNEWADLTFKRFDSDEKIIEVHKGTFLVEYFKVNEYEQIQDFVEANL